VLESSVVAKASWALVFLSGDARRGMGRAISASSSLCFSMLPLDLSNLSKTGREFSPQTSSLPNNLHVPHQCDKKSIRRERLKASPQVLSSPQISSPAGVDRCIVITATLPKRGKAPEITAGSGREGEKRGGSGPVFGVSHIGGLSHPRFSLDKCMQRNRNSASGEGGNLRTCERDVGKFSWGRGVTRKGERGRRGTTDP
jgi:hypothetical protein